MPLIYFYYRPGLSGLVRRLFSGKSRLVLLFVIACCLQHCQPHTAQELASDATGSKQNAYTDTTQVHVRYAKGFTILYHDHYKVLLIHQGKDTIRYLLLPNGVQQPDKEKADQIIRIPVRKVITQSTTHLGMISFLEADSIVSGLDNADYVYSQKIRQRVVERKIQEVGGGENLNTEMVMALAPDLLIVSGMPGTTLEGYRSLTAAGIPVLVNSEWMEKSLLAKAEWIKLIAALTNQETLAEQKFTAIETRYDSIAALVTPVDQRPQIISGSPFQDAWYVPGGDSYRSQLFQQAGGSWPWASDTSAVSIMVSYETMYAYGLKADFWLNPGQIASKQELLAKDSRFADFKAFRNDQIYNNNRRMNEKGSGNDYFESGVVHPERVLADVIKILHPDLLPNDSLFYYQKLK